MALGTASLLVAGLGVAGAGLSIMQGYAAGKESNRQAQASAFGSDYNARIYEQQAGMIGEQQRIEGEQYDRLISRTRSKGVARTAGAGLLLSGSPLAVMVDTETQQQLDKSIGQYNLEIEKRYALSGANRYRQEGAYYREQGKRTNKAAIFQGYTNAFTGLLSTATNVSMMNMTPTMPTTAKTTTMPTKYFNNPSMWAFKG